jgi:hypothetical protein
MKTPRLAVFAVFFVLYLMSSSRERPWGDAHTVFDVAESIVDHGSVAVPTRWPIDLPPGRNGKFYCINPLVTSLVHVPGVALHRLVSKARPDLNGVLLPFMSHLAPAAAGALVCLLFLGLARRFSGDAAASWTTLFLGVATGIWVYARYPYTEILQAACFTGFFAELERTLAEPSNRRARWLGLWAGLLVNTKLIYVMALPGAVLLLLWRNWRSHREWLRLMLWSASTFVPLLFVILLYNWVRFGSFLDSGYHNFAMTGRVWVGLLGLFFSPGKSFLLYNPVILVALIALPRFVRRHPWTAAAMAVTILPVVLVYAKFQYWAGDYAWGPRYLVFAIPVILLPAAVGIDAVLASVHRRFWIPALALLVALGVAVQLLGNALYWDHYIRIVREATPGWLGNPNRSGATLPDRGGICDACFEDLYGYEWLPPFQPIAGHYWLTKHVLHDHDWKTAERDAPWHMYTRLNLAIPASYPRARIDWWTLDYGEHHGAAGVLWFLLSVTFAAGVFGWWRWLKLQRIP